jgi:predicted aspartyl protease
LKLQYRNGLLFASIKISYHGNSTIVDNVVIDTGATSSIIELSAIEDLGIRFTKDDEIETFYGVNGMFSYIKRTADYIALGDKSANDYTFYVGSIDETINGLIGLDLLIKLNAVINLKEMKISFE